MPNPTFSATVSDWCRKVPEVHLAVFRESAKRVMEDMLTPRGAGGNMPIDTGYLRASLQASTTEMPTMREGAIPTEGATYTPDGQVNLVIAGAELGETIYAGFTAIYARAQNYGFKGPAFLFVELAAQKWEATVAAVEAELLSRAGLT